MSTTNTNLEFCSCGRFKDTRHCPNCGTSTYYALVRPAVIQNKQTGEMQTATVFRCRKCSEYFNDLEWRTDCHAPLLTQKKPKQLILESERMTIKSQLIEAAKTGRTFTHNDKLHFRKVTGIDYDMFMRLFNEQAKVIAEGIQTGRRPNETVHDYVGRRIAEVDAKDIKKLQKEKDLDQIVAEDNQTLLDYLKDDEDKETNK